MEEDRLLDTNVVMEGAQGITTILSIVEFPKALNRVSDALWPERQDYLKAIQLMDYLRSKGRPIPGMDLIIASIALNRNLTLVTKDKHFERIPGLKLELVE